MGKDTYCSSSDPTPSLAEHGHQVRIVHAAWHPLSDAHVVVLSSDHCLRIFDLRHSFLKPTQEYALDPRTFASEPVSFCFGSSRGWERLTIYIMLVSSAVSIPPTPPQTSASLQ